jgi:ribosomal protein S18 acetylase RimI-like enzyme
VAVSQPENLDNLFSLYSFLGNVCEGVTVVSYEGFKVVHSETSGWPNISFDVGGSTFNEDTVERITGAMVALKQRPTIILPYDPGQTGILRKAGYLPTDQWTGMSYRFNPHVSSPSMPEGDISVFSIADTDGICAWTAVVNETLFERQNVDPGLFQCMVMNGTELVGISVGAEWAGSAMIYSDVDGRSGIYMVSIRGIYRNRGLGRSIMNYCLQQIERRGVSKCYLQSTRAGLDLYKSLGFKEFDKYIIYCKIK